MKRNSPVPETERPRVRPTLVCVAVGVADQAEALRLMARESRHADVIEIRLDCLEKHDPEPFAAAAATPLLFTVRPEWEGGAFRGSEAERIELLVRATRAGAAFVDCELRAPEGSRTRLRDAVAGSATRLILSWHDFSATPPRAELARIVAGMAAAGADVGKIVTTAVDHLDVVRVLGLQEEAAALDFPLIGFCMGEAGTISRIATVRLGGFMTYCSPGTGAATAPGQIDAPTLRACLAALNAVDATEDS